MSMTIEREKALELFDNIQKLIYENIDLKTYFSLDIEKTDTETLFQGVSNGYISELLHSLLGIKPEVVGDAEALYACPCCGYKTLTERYDTNEGTGYDICPYCFWEDDGTTDADMYVSINRGSITDYQKKIKEVKNKYYIEKWYK